MRNQWEVPAGKIEINETPREAAYRELLEETHQNAIGLKFIGLFKIHDKIYNEIRYRCIFVGYLNYLTDFKKEENDEMSCLTLWDGYSDIGYIDEVDLKIVNMVMGLTKI